MFVLLCSLWISVPAAVADSFSANVPRISSDSLQKSVSLQGDWQFKPGDNLQWASPDFDDSDWTSLEVPNPWPRGGYPEFGQMAWYRLTLQLDKARINEEQLSKVAVRIGKVVSAYEFYVNGELMGGAGKLPPLSVIDYDLEQVFKIPSTVIADDGKLVLAVRLWGGPATALAAWSGGMRSGDLRLGEYQSLVSRSVLSEIPELIFNGLIFFVGLYHLYLYFRNRSLKAFCWFGLMAMDIALYGMMLTQWKYQFDMSFLVMKKIEYGAIFSFTAFSIQMVWALLKVPVGRILRAYQASFLLLTAIVVLTPGHAVQFITLTFWQFWVIPAMAYAPYVMYREMRSGNKEARTLFMAVVLFLATCLNDLFIDLAHLNTVRLMAFGFLAVMVAMAVSLANNFTSLYKELEDKVKQRTAQLSEANTQLAEVARIDHLTGLYNRRGFTEEVEQEIRRVFRSGKSFSIILADVDYFKRFNDSYGHDCGDHVLKRVGAILKERKRDVDHVARWGGEEFILLLPETTAEGAAVLGEKLREAVSENLFAYEEQRLSITMTFGIAEHRKGETMDSTISRADTALYHGKERGRNRVMIGNYKGLTLVH